MDELPLKIKQEEIVLEDLILAAYNDAKKKAGSKANKSMSLAGLPSNVCGV